MKFVFFLKVLSLIIEKEKNVTEKEQRVISYCFNVILATVILCYIVLV